MFQQAEAILIQVSHHIPLPLFAFFASFVEEVIAPLPSPAVMIVTGTLASIQQKGLFFLFLLSIIAAVGKTLGAIVVYKITNYLGEKTLSRFGSIIALKKEDIQSLQNKLTGTRRDFVVLTTLRAFPFLPSVLLSVGCGLIGVPLRLFMVSTCIGTIVRDSLYLSAGYSGANALMGLIRDSNSLEHLIELGAIITIVGVLVFLIIKKRRELRK